MDVVRIRGGSPLSGRIQVSGAKNAALPIFAAALLTDEPVTISNVPDLSDLRYMAEIMEFLGTKVERLDSSTWRFTTPTLGHLAPYDLVRKMRASICLLGPMVARLRKAEISLPGGCVIGPRPVDLHIKGLKQMGCKVEVRGGNIHVDGRNVKGQRVFLGGRYGSTVTGTHNILMAAVMTPGTTLIESAACEPEVNDLANMLVKMGAKIEGIGSHQLVVTGVDKLHGCNHAVMPDRIEAGTFLIAGAITEGDLTVTGANPSDMGSLIDKLEEAQVRVTVKENGDIRVQASPRIRQPVEIVTLPYPGFPTDLQAQFLALMALTPGISIITERVYPNRFMHVPELQRMGADIAIEGANAIVNGKQMLSGAPVMASDLRASAALILAGLAAEGETWVQRIYHLDRGYEKIDQKLKAVGADIERLPQSEMPKGYEDEG